MSPFYVFFFEKQKILTACCEPTTFSSKTICIDNFTTTALTLFLFYLELVFSLECLNPSLSSLLMSPDSSTQPAAKRLRAAP